MAANQPSQSLKQAIRSVRWIVNSLNHPLASLDVPIDGLEWQGLNQTLPLVEFDPLAQFSSPVASEQSTTNDTRSARNSHQDWSIGTPSASQVSDLLSKNPPANSAAPATPVFSLHPRSSISSGRSLSDPPSNRSEPSSPLSAAVHEPFYREQAHRVEPPPRHGEPHGKQQNSDRTIVQPAPPSSSGLSHSQLTSQALAVAGAIAAPIVPNMAPDLAPNIATVTMIEQVVNQLLSSPSYAAAAADSVPLLPPIATNDSTASPADMPSLHALSSRRSFTMPPTSISLSAFDLMAANSIAGRSNPAIAHSSRSPGSDTGFDAEFDAEFGMTDSTSFNAENTLADMSETLTLLVNDVLVEQARRHGVDLS